MDQTLKKFIQVTESLSHKTHLTPLSNISFILGAGFSKSWDSKYPLGTELFSISNSSLRKTTILEEFLIGHLGTTKINFNIFKDIVYSLNMQLKYSFIKTRYIDTQAAQFLLNELRKIVVLEFNNRILTNKWNFANGKFNYNVKLNKEQHLIIKFFRWLGNLDRITGDKGFPEGVRFNCLTTNYDFLIEAIIDSGLPSDDSIFNYQYRGFIPSKINGQLDNVMVQDHYNNMSIIKLNGGFELFNGIDGIEIDYVYKDSQLNHIKSPVIMLPSREQDYQSHYFSEILQKSIRILQETKVLVIIGYSMPEEDSIVRFILKQFAEDTSDLVNKYIFYIDKMAKKEQFEKINNLFPGIKNTNISINLFSGSLKNWLKGF
jgi:hypothetical protein